MDEFAKREAGTKPHGAGTIETPALARIEAMLPAAMERTAETGCGKSTVLFSNLSRHHTVFCIDDRTDGDGSSVRFFEQNELAKREVVHLVFGPSQLTLPKYHHAGEYDCVLLDGPHAYPFPELEYYFFYPHIRRGGILIVDDVHIPTVGRMADVIQEDDMFELLELVGTTAVFRRTLAETLSPTGCGWWTQKFNRRRMPPTWEIHCADGKLREPFAARFAGEQANRPTADGSRSPEPIHGLKRRLRRAARVLLLGH